MEGEVQPNNKFIPELDAPNPDSVKKYVLAQQNRDVAYRELVDCLLPEEDRLYHQMDINNPNNLNILSLGLQRKQNLEAIMNKRNVPDNLTAIINQLPPEALSEPGNELTHFLSPLEQKVLSGASRNESEDVEDFLIKQSLLAIAYNRQKQKDYEVSKVTTPKFYPELAPPNPDSVKQYVFAQPEAKQNESYRELVGFLLPQEDRLYHKLGVNNPKNLNFLSLGLQRKQNLELILNKRKVSDNLTAILGQLPPEVLSQPYDELISFLSPLELKVFSTASKTASEDVDNFLVKQSLLAIAYNRSLYGMKK